MNPIDIAGITLLLFVFSLIIVIRVRQEIHKSSEEIRKELIEIKKLLENPER